MKIKELTVHICIYLNVTSLRITVCWNDTYSPGSIENWIINLKFFIITFVSIAVSSVAACWLWIKWRTIIMIIKITIMMMRGMTWSTCSNAIANIQHKARCFRIIHISIVFCLDVLPNSNSQKDTPKQFETEQKEATECKSWPRHSFRLAYDLQSSTDNVKQRNGKLYLGNNESVITVSAWMFISNKIAFTKSLVSTFSHSFVSYRKWYNTSWLLSKTCWSWNLSLIFATRM